MSLDGLKVLLVEDEAIIAMMVEELLGDMGCRVVASPANCPRPSHSPNARCSTARSST
jgi:CheY-like chemotaxis protein